MMMLVRLAWRNILRNKRRTLLSGIAVGIGLASIIFVQALFTGMLNSMVRTATDTIIGEGQIHLKGFRDTYDPDKTIRNSKALMKDLESEEVLEYFTPRTISFAMISSAAGVQSVMLYGVQPLTERPVSAVDDAIIKGNYLGPEETGMILIGSKTASTLEVEIGDRIVVTTAQAHTGELAQEMFRVGGIFHFGSREADSGLVFVDLKKAQGLLGLGEDIHEIALKFRSLDMAGDTSLYFWKKYSRDGNEAIGWKVMVPQLESVVEMSHISMGITMLLVFGIVGLTIMNSLFMSLYERMFEFGLLRALGTRPLRMAALIFLEAASLSLVSIVIGSFLGLAVTWYFSVHGINYKGIEFAGITITELIFPVLSVEQFTLYPLLVMVFSLAAAIYPAFYAAKLTPARAMRRSI
ncbi:MAG: FtsX-like permease family protein [Nitrospirota bacterium]|nr:FtsX-like permease family protein [Nitrospirota bacterium]